MRKHYFTFLPLVFMSLFVSAQLVTEDFSDVSYVDGPLNDHPKWTVGTDAQFTVDATNDLIQGNLAYARAIYTPVFKGTEGSVITATAWVEFGSSSSFNSGNEGDFIGVIGFKHEAAGFNNNSEAVRVLSNSTAETLFLNRLGPAGTFDGTAPSMTWDNKGEYKITAELLIGSSAATSTFSAKLENVSTGVSTTVAVATGIYSPLYNAIVSETATEGAHFYIHNQNLGGDLASFTTYNKFTIDDTSTLSTSNLNSIEVSMYPNPASENITISTLEEITSVSIVDMTGAEFPANLSGSTIDVATLTSGIYLLKLTSANGSSIQKFVKK